MSLSQEMVDRATQLSTDYDIHLVVDPVIDGELGVIEHLVHELAHAEMLGLEAVEGECLGDAIASVLDSEGEDTAHLHEAYAWAVEWHALGHLGLRCEDDEWGRTCGCQDKLHWGEVRDHAEIQGVYDHQVAAHLEDERILEAAVTVAEHVWPGCIGGA